MQVSPEKLVISFMRDVPAQQMREFEPCVNRNPDTGDILRDDSGFSGSGYATVQPCDEPQVKQDVQSCGNGQKSKGNYRIPQRAKQ